MTTNNTSQGGYENAPATRMLASFCACCARPLVDARSVETGVGPECRRRHGYTDNVPEDVREQVNRLVYEIALQQDGIEAAQKAQQVFDLGLHRVADRIFKRIIKVDIVFTSDEMLVKAPYSEEARAAGAWRTVPGARWDRAEKRWVAPTSSKPALWALLKRFYPGALGRGGQGPFVVPAQ